MPVAKPMEMVVDEPKKVDVPGDVSMDESKKTSLEEVPTTETLALNYDSEDGSLEKDKALQTFKIPDDDKRWQLLDLSGGLKKLILKEGEEEKPDDGQKVSCHYSGFLRSNGKMFDSSRERGDLFSFELGKGSVIKGWDVGIATMHIGERAILRCSSDFAYGEKGSPPNIPGGATLDFIVQLKEVQQYEFLWNTEDAKNSISKKNIKKTETWETAEKLWVVTLTYTGREKDEKGRIWCSGKNEKVKIPFDLEFEGKGIIPDFEMPRGFYVCVKNTKKDEVNHFKLKSNDFYTFGSTGSTKFGIAPNTDLFFEISVTDFEKFHINSWKLDAKEKIPRALELKDIANKFFKRKKLRVAKEVYEDIIKITKDMKDMDADKAKDISLTCYSNMALVETQLNNFSEASEQIEKGLEIDSKHYKLRYRKAFLHFKKGDFFTAGQLLDDLVKEFPEIKALRILERKNTRASKESDKKARKLARKMFGPKAAKKLNDELRAAADKEKAAPAGGKEDTKKPKAGKVAKKDAEATEINDEEMAPAKSESKPAEAEIKPATKCETNPTD